jgi:hypothetical protein
MGSGGSPNKNANKIFPQDDWLETRVDLVDLFVHVKARRTVKSWKSLKRVSPASTLLALQNCTSSHHPFPFTRLLSTTAPITR